MATKILNSYMPPKHFKACESLPCIVQEAADDGSELWLIRLPANEVRQSDLMDKTLKLKVDLANGRLGHFSTSQGQQLDIVKHGKNEMQQLYAIIPNGPDPFTVKKISCQVGFVKSLILENGLPKPERSSQVQKETQNSDIIVEKKTIEISETETPEIEEREIEWPSKKIVEKKAIEILETETLEIEEREVERVERVERPRKRIVEEREAETIEKPRKRIVEKKAIEIPETETLESEEREVEKVERPRKRIVEEREAETVEKPRKRIVEKKAIEIPETETPEIEEREVEKPRKKKRRRSDAPEGIDHLKSGGS